MNTDLQNNIPTLVKQHGYLNAGWFGLRDHQDCTLAFQQAALFMLGNGTNAGYEHSKYFAVGPRLFIPSGIYHIHDTILIPGYCEVEGAFNTTLIGKGMEGKPIFQCGGVDNLIKGINFVGGKYSIAMHGTWNDPSNGQVGLWGNPEAGGRFHVVDCGFYDCGHSAITVKGLEVQNRTTTTAHVLIDRCEAQCLRLWTGSADFLTISNGRFVFDRRNYSYSEHYRHLGFINTGTPVNIVDSVFGLRGDYYYPVSSSSLIRTPWGVSFTRCGQGDGKSAVVTFTNPLSSDDFTAVNDGDNESYIILDQCGFSGVADIYWLYAVRKIPSIIKVINSIPFDYRPHGNLAWTKGMEFVGFEPDSLNTRLTSTILEAWTSDNPDALRGTIAGPLAL